MKNKSSSLWWARYVGDYQRKTAHLSLMEHGAYTLLLDHYYATEKPLPASVEHLLRICRAFAEDEQKAVHSVLTQFFEKRGSFYHHKRADEELSKRKEINEKRRKAGVLSRKRVSANAIAHAPTHASANAVANAPANAYTSTTTSTTITKDTKKDKQSSQDRASIVTPPKPKFLAIKPPDVAPDVWEDFLKVRQSKRAPVTKTAIEGIEREAASAGISLNEALAICCQRGWAGFKAEWHNRDKPQLSRNMQKLKELHDEGF